MTTSTVKTQKTAFSKKGIRNAAASLLLLAAGGALTDQAHAYDMQANTIYAHASGGIYAIDVDAGTANRVAEAKASLSSIQDIAFDGSTMYGINLHWQLMKLEANESEAVSVKEAESYSLQFQGLAAHNGVLYGAELRSLVTLDKATGNPGALCSGCLGYGLGAGEQVTDLAFAADGTLYASVQFPGIPYSYLGTVSTQTGALMLLGNTGVENIMAITVKDGVIYAMDRAGDLFTLNEASGFATDVASGVLPGVTGMDTSPVMISAIDTGSTAEPGSDETSGGSLSAYGLLLMLLVAALRRFRYTV